MAPRASKTSLILFILGLSGLCFLAFAATIRTRREILGHAKILRHFEQAKIANHDLNENVLRLRTFLLLTYDPLVRDVDKLHALCKTMLNASDFAQLRHDETKVSLNRFCAAAEEKGRLIESYKSKYAILRNSIKYLPLLNSQLSSTRFASVSHSILTSVLLYNLEPSPELAADIDKSLAQLKQSKPSSTEGPLLESLGLHATSVLRQSEARQQLESEILSVEFGRRLEQLESAYLNDYQARQHNDLILQFALILLCTALVMGLVRLFQKLKMTGEILSDLNINLEQKVKERTEELSVALNQLSQNQQLLIQSTKMTALGEMAGGIAHEINTPLSAIMLNAEMLVDNADDMDPAQLQKRGEAIIRIVERVSKIIMGLKRFSRKNDQSARALFALNAIIEDTLTLCAEKLKSHSIQVQVDAADPDLKLFCVPEHISQVLMNFLNNSLDALSESVAPSERWIRISAQQKDGQVELSVTDAGHGLSEAVQSKLMQPFFTTKPPGIGTGIGLSISKGIVEQHGGRLFYDKSCANTRFVMQFPQSSTSIAA